MPNMEAGPGTAAPDTTEERRGLSRGQYIADIFVHQEPTAERAVREQARELQNTDISQVGSGNIIWRGAKSFGRGAGRFGKYAIVYPVLLGGATVLAGGGLAAGIGVGAGGLAYILGRETWKHGEMTYKSHGFGDSFQKNWQHMHGHFSTKKK